MEIPFYVGLGVVTGLVVFLGLLYRRDAMAASGHLVRALDEERTRHMDDLKEMTIFYQTRERSISAELDRANVLILEQQRLLLSMAHTPKRSRGKKAEESEAIYNLTPTAHNLADRLNGPGGKNWAHEATGME